MCDELWGVPGCVTKCDRGRWVKIDQKIAWRTLWTTPFLLFHCLLRHYTISSRFHCSVICLLRHCTVLGFSCLLFYLLRHYYIFKFPLFHYLFVASLTALFAASIAPSSVCYVTILLLKVSNAPLSVCYVIALFSASAVSSSICFVTIHLQVSTV